MRGGLAASLRTRQQAIRELWDQVDRRLIETHWPHLPVQVMQKTTYEQLKLLVDAGSMTLSEWRDRTGKGVPNGDPFHPVIRVEGDRIVLDREALLAVGSARRDQSRRYGTAPAKAGFQPSTRLV